MDREGVLAKLRRIDENAFFSGEVPEGRKATVVIVGGSALLLQQLSAKPATKDVDVLAVEDALRAFLLEDPDFNMGCQAYCTCLLYNFEDRLVEVGEAFRSMRVFIPSPEDLAVMKLYRWEAPDRADLTSAAFLDALDRDLLERLVLDPGEAAASRIADPEKDREYQNLLFHYGEYRDGWLA